MSYPLMSALDQHERPLWLGLGIRLDDGAASTTEHLAIVKAVKDRDPEAARKLMREHISHSEERIATALTLGGY